MKYLLVKQGWFLNLGVILYPSTQEIVLVCALSKANGSTLQSPPPPSASQLPQFHLSSGLRDV
jgi:hypothetical protein